LPWQVFQIGFRLFKVYGDGIGSFLHYLSDFERKIAGVSFCLFLKEIEHAYEKLGGCKINPLAQKTNLSGIIF
jgi:hypothetical protein